MDKIEQIEKAIKAENDRFFYAATAPKTSLEIQMIIFRVQYLLELKYEILAKGDSHE